MHKMLSAAMIDCVYHQPSIFILDDIETITSPLSGEEENTPDAMNASRCVEWHKRFAVIRKFQPKKVFA